jgi:hypothetical protein
VRGEDMVKGERAQAWCTKPTRKQRGQEAPSPEVSLLTFQGRRCAGHGSDDVEGFENMSQNNDDCSIIMT